MKTIYTQVILITLLAFPGYFASAQFTIQSLPTQGTYNQHFNSLPSYGSVMWTDLVTIPNWYLQRVPTSGGIPPFPITLNADDGNTSLGSGYNYGLSLSSDRALGSLGTTNTSSGHYAWGIQFQNTSGYPVSDFKVTYLGEQWRDGGSSSISQIIKFYYKKASAPITNLQPATYTGWTAVPGLNFINPINSGVAQPLNGNTASCSVEISSNLPGLTLTNGEYIMMKWDDPKYSGVNDHGMATDSVYISWNVCSPPTLQASGIASVSTGQNALSLQWNNGNGAGRYVVINTVNSFNIPINGVENSSANPVYNGVGEQVVYAGTGNSVSVSNLLPCTHYYFRVFEFNCSGTNIIYSVTTAQNNPASFTTAGNNVSSSTSVSACGAYFWNGLTYNTSGSYSAFFPGGSVLGCDSTAILNLTITSLPVVNAGPDMTICNTTVALFNGTAMNYSPSSVSWTSTGTGVLLNASTFNPVYTPGINESGLVFFTLTVSGMGPCSGQSASDIVTLQIFPSPTPTLTGPANVCLGSTAVYTTESGGSSYLWSVSAGGTISPGGAANSVSVTWNSPGNQFVHVNYTGANGCTSATSAILTVTVSSQSTGGNITGDAIAFEGLGPVSLALGGYSGSILKWQKRANSGTWTDLPFTTNVLNDVPTSVGTWIYRAEVQNGACTSVFSDEFSVEVLNRTLQVTVFLEGLFNVATGEMNKAQDETGEKYPGNTADLVTIGLARNTPPYNQEYLFDNIALPVNGIIPITLPAGSTSAYYIVVKHRNSIETWSSTPVSLNVGSTTYDFTTGSEKALGNNLKSKGSVFVMYGADINQDGLVDSGDMISTDNLSAVFTTGYLPEDTNGDGLIDATDLISVDNNASEFIAKVVPL